MTKINKESNKNKKIFLVANCCWYIFNFRLSFLKTLKDKGYKIFIIAPSDRYKNKIIKYSDKYINWKLYRGSINPILELISFFQLIFLYIKHKPTLIHHFTIKPSLYGGIVAKILNHKKVIAHITGIGPSFYGFNKRMRIISYLIRPLYRFAFYKNSSVVIFHNIFDKKKFVKLGICRESSSYVIQGSGVDIKHFSNKEVKTKYNQPIQILFPARIIREKGIIELIKACEILWSKGKNFNLNIAGEIDLNNKSSLNIKELEKISSNKFIKLYGKSDDMKEIYLKNDIVILPSWREGLSKSLLEAASMNLPIITTNVPGCREIVQNNKSGILVPLKDKNGIKEAILELINDSKLGLKYGLYGRRIVMKKFKVKDINAQILSIYKILLER